MNRVELTGRMVRDPEVRYTTGSESMAFAKFTIAVDRRFAKRDEGKPTADFIGCTAFGKTAEFLEKYFKKGQRIGVSGRIQTGSYTNKDGIKVYTTDVIADEIEFGSDKVQSGEGQSYNVNVEENVDEELPFV